MSATLSLSLYRAAMSLFESAAPAILRGRARRGKEDAARLPERLGHASLQRPDGPLVWLHGVSVGESLSLLPLIDRIRTERPDINLLVTTGTVTSAELMRRRLPDGVIHQFVPVDGPKAVARFLDHWRPDVGLFAESELWPNLILAARALGTRLGLISARITDKTAVRWSKRKKTAGLLLSAFELILPQDGLSITRLQSLGAKPGPILNLKYVADPLPADPAEMGRLRMGAAGRKVIVAASTHPGEERLIAQAVVPGPLLVIVPRHPERGDDIYAEMAILGRKVARRSQGETLTNSGDVYIADTLGELGLFFRLADLVLMGGSLIPGIGGHNPLEPARLGKAVVSGKHVHNFDDVYGELGAREGAIIVDASNLPALNYLIGQTDRLKAMNTVAETYALSLRDQFEEGWTLIKALLT